LPTTITGMPDAGSSDSQPVQDPAAENDDAKQKADRPRSQAMGRGDTSASLLGGLRGEGELRQAASANASITRHHCLMRGGGVGVITTPQPRLQPSPARASVPRPQLLDAAVKGIGLRLITYAPVRAAEPAR